MTELELARLKRQLREVSEEAQEVTKTLKIFAAQCQEVSRIMRSIRDSYTLAEVPNVGSSADHAELDTNNALPVKQPELTVIDGGRPL